jgi:hypothetical protein
MAPGLCIIPAAYINTLVGAFGPLLKLHSKKLVENTATNVIIILPV